MKSIPLLLHPPEGRYDRLAITLVNDTEAVSRVVQDISHQLPFELVARKHHPISAAVPCPDEPGRPSPFPAFGDELAEVRKRERRPAVQLIDVGWDIGNGKLIHGCEDGGGDVGVHGKRAILLFK
jgi:hypothetical protein